MSARIFGKPVASLEYHDIERLVAAKVAESRELDYKGEVDREPKEICRDVSAFANTDGGVLIYGVEEKLSIPTRIVGVSGFTRDKDERRFSDIVRTGLEPSLTAITIKVLTGEAGRDVVVVGIPRSFAAPHGLTVANGGTFWRRGDKQRYQMGATMLREAFEETDYWRNEADRWKEDRLRQMEKGGIVPWIGSGTRAVLLHVIPLGRLRGSIDVPRVLPDWWKFFDPGGLPVKTTHRPNLAGWLIDAPGEESQRRHTQVFRHGGVEVGWSLENFGVPAGERHPFLEGRMLEEELVKRVEQSIDWFDRADIAPPFAVYVTLHLRSLYRLIGKNSVIGPAPGFNQEEFSLPTFVLDERPSTVDVAARIKPLLDTLWQAAGWDASPYFDELGWTLSVRRPNKPNA